jgi:LPS sulfotransferase NodH
MSELIRKTVKLTKELPYYLSRRWHEIMQPNSNREYTRFVILSRKRSGTTFLQTALQQNPQVQAFGELFGSHRRSFWDAPGYMIEPLNQKVYALRDQDMHAYMERYIYRSYPKSIHAVGFKLFFIQGDKKRKDSIWNYLEQDPSVRMIRLVRENYLAVLTSKQEAMQTEQWVMKDQNGTKERAPVTLDPEECAYLFECFDIEDRMLRERFSDHPYKYVTYESLVRDPAVFKEIQEFLGVDPITLKPSTKKQSHRSLMQRIANYEELKAHFRGTQWDRFFKD